MFDFRINFRANITSAIANSYHRNRPLSCSITGQFKEKTLLATCALIVSQSC